MKHNVSKKKNASQSKSSLCEDSNINSPNYNDNFLTNYYYNNILPNYYNDIPPNDNNNNNNININKIVLNEENNDCRLPSTNDLAEQVDFQTQQKIIERLQGIIIEQQQIIVKQQRTIDNNLSSSSSSSSSSSPYKHGDLDSYQHHQLRIPSPHPHLHKLQQSMVAFSQQQKQQVPPQILMQIIRHIPLNVLQEALQKISPQKQQLSSPPSSFPLSPQQQTLSQTTAVPFSSSSSPFTSHIPCLQQQTLSHFQQSPQLSYLQQQSLSPIQQSPNSSPQLQQQTLQSQQQIPQKRPSLLALPQQEQEQHIPHKKRKSSLSQEELSSSSSLNAPMFTSFVNIILEYAKIIENNSSIITPSNTDIYHPNILDTSSSSQHSINYDHNYTNKETEEDSFSGSEYSEDNDHDNENYMSANKSDYEEEEEKEENKSSKGTTIEHEKENSPIVFFEERAANEFDNNNWNINQDKLYNAIELLPEQQFKKWELYNAYWENLELNYMKYFKNSYERKKQHIEKRIEAIFSEQHDDIRLLKNKSLENVGKSGEVALYLHEYASKQFDDELEALNLKYDAIFDAVKDELRDRLSKKRMNLLKGDITIKVPDDLVSAGYEAVNNMILKSKEKEQLDEKKIQKEKHKQKEREEYLQTIRLEEDFESMKRVPILLDDTTEEKHM